MLSRLDVRYSAYAKLHAILAKHNPGSSRYEQVEHALDLCLNDGRTVGDFLVRNLLRDSKRVLDRQAKKRSFVPIAESLLDDFEESSIDNQAIILVESDTPESIIEAEQMAESILTNVDANSQHTQRVFKGLLAGESLADTATACGISSVRVNQLRSALRRTAGELRS